MRFEPNSCAVNGGMVMAASIALFLKASAYCVNGSTFQEEADPTRLVPMRSFLFWNAGDNGYFEVSERCARVLTTPRVARGASFADYDGDGDLDLAVVAHGGPLVLARNDGGNRRGWARIVLRSGKAVGEALVTQRAKLADLPAAFELQCDKASTIKVMVSP